MSASIDIQRGQSRWYERTVLAGRCASMLGCLSCLPLLAVAPLQPTLSRMVDIRFLVLLEFGQESTDAVDGSSRALLGRMVRRFDPSQRRARGEKRQQVRGELVRHPRCEVD